jgi:hypothetical protein
MERWREYLLLYISDDFIGILGQKLYHIGDEDLSEQDYVDEILTS